MASRINGFLQSRQDQDLPAGWVVDDDGIARPWWYTHTAYIVKWSVFLGVFSIIGIYLVGGYLHAKSRLRKGLLPLRYHRWMITRRELARIDPRYAPPQPTYMMYPPAYYSVQPMAPPPVYEPPSGASKIDPSQWPADPTRRTEPNEPAPVYGPPPGPPPSAAHGTPGNFVRP